MLRSFIKTSEKQRKPKIGHSKQLAVETNENCHGYRQ